MDFQFRSDLVWNLVQELAGSLGIRPLTHPVPAAAIAAFFPAVLLYGGNWKHLWPIFGASNFNNLILSIICYMSNNMDI